MTIAEILRRKGTGVVSVRPQDGAVAVARTLAEHRIGAALVCDETGAVLGIVSERDIVRALAAEGGEALLAMDAARLMTRVLHTVTPRTSVVEALGMMTDRRVRHLPVLADDGSLAGIVSIGDLVKHRIVEVEHEAEELRSYVAQAG
ncbi:CBS domain-containing protein [Caldovatus aquaticus]|uniref:CBS domain-containing protein n=1 Tax=Caldovatus aquaticus TaxID=2865671 RepID=A0ABS7F0G8_9PROT|nr:CBS domain-containing protein [Caldovatus aquaticus]MBW8269054.1 CBS domain-containing protein [Caldovatus aquaticus]